MRHPIKSLRHPATAARDIFSIGDKARFVVFARDGLAFPTAAFSIDEHPIRPDVPYRVRHWARPSSNLTPCSDEWNRWPRQMSERSRLFQGRAVSGAKQRSLCVFGRLRMLPIRQRPKSRSPAEGNSHSRPPSPELMTPLHKLLWRPWAESIVASRCFCLTKSQSHTKVEGQAAARAGSKPILGVPAGRNRGARTRVSPWGMLACLEPPRTYTATARREIAPWSSTKLNFQKMVGSE